MFVVEALAKALHAEGLAGEARPQHVVLGQIPARKLGNVGEELLRGEIELEHEPGGPVLLAGGRVYVGHAEVLVRLYHRLDAAAERRDAHGLRPPGAVPAACQAPPLRRRLPDQVEVHRIRLAARGSGGLAARGR